MPDKSDLDDDFALKPQQQPGELPLGKSKAAKKTAARGKGKAAAQTDQAAILSYRHDQKRKNNPDVGVVTPETDPEQPKTVWAYDPHIDPALQFDSGRAQIEKLIDDALGSGDEAVMRAALEQLKRQSAPYLNWTGKAERTSFEVDTVSLHVHERIDPMSILSALRKELKNPSPSGRGASQSHPSPPGRGAGVRASGYQPGLFEAPFENLPLRDAVDFYKHEKGWSNRLISGDSLLVMNSLLQKESMAGQVQMIYLDPPYGIKYGSNFQPFTNKRDVKDRKDEDLTQEPEMIKAFRDTWELGIHSYLTYLRDRLLLAKELLHESGSVFVQISDENLHHVRELLDELFGAENFVSQIVFKTKKMALGQKYLGTVCDIICWYAKDIHSLKYRQLYKERAGLESDDETPYQIIQTPLGELRRLKASERENPEEALNLGRLLRTLDLHSSGRTESCVFAFDFQGKVCEPQRGRSWKTNPTGMTRLNKAGRLLRFGESPEYKLFFDDYPVQSLMSLWDDTQGASDKQYVVQTATKIIERCLLMTTDPGDLVLDPTCGSGTTAFVAEKWGRRWITCDTSRVAVTLAKQRLMTASYDYYALRYPHEGLKGGFIYKTVPHVTLKSIANNPEIDEIYERMHPAIEAALAELNRALSPTPLPRGRGAQGVGGAVRLPC
jgi:Adenine specific DNA methylase Mod